MNERAADSPLIERGAELRVLSSVVRAADGRRGGVAVIAGPAGIGKTSLVDAAAHMAAERGMRVLRARGVELEAEFGYGVIRQLFERQPAAPPGRRRGLTGAARFATAALARNATPGTPAADPHAVLNGLYWLAVDMSWQSGLVVCVDDAQWADEASLRCLAYLAPRIDDERIAVVVAARTADMREGVRGMVLDALVATASTASMRPVPLSADGTLEMVRRATSPDAEAAFATACHELTGGNPLLIQELLRALASQGIAPRTEKVPMLRQVAPDAITSAVRARMSRLSEAERAVAGAVAVLEPRCDVRNVAAVAELDVDRCAAILDALATKDILTHAPSPMFVHPVIREATISAMAAFERSRAHLRAARLLARDGAATEIVATHLLEARPAHNGWVVKMLLQAAAEAASRGAPGAAVMHLRRALEEPPPPDQRGRVLLALARAEFQAELPESTEHLREAMDSAADSRSRAQAALLLGHALVASGDAATAERIAIEARHRVPGDSELELALEAMLLMSQTLGRSPPKLDHRLAALGQSLTGATESERVLLSRIALAKAAVGDCVDDVRDIAFRSLKDGRLELEQPELFGGPRPAYVLMLCDELHRPEGLLAQYLEQARGAGMLPWIGLACAIRAMTAMRRGEVGLAETSALDSLALSHQRSFAFWIPMALGALANALLERGAVGEARERLRSTPPPPQLAGTWVMGYLHHAQGRVNLAAGDAAAALTEFEAAGESLLSHDFTNPSFVEWRSDAARVRLLLGDRVGATVLAAEELRIARAFGAPRAIGVALGAVAAVSSDDRLALLEEAVVTLASSQARLDYASALLDLGSTLRRQGQRMAARERLGAALELGHDCGSALVNNRAVDELEALGVRRPRAESRDLNALTPSEERVARMAGAGMTNREIAEALYVTPKTVDTHLYHVYAKLGISTRRQLTKFVQLPNHLMSRGY